MSEPVIRLDAVTKTFETAAVRVEALRGVTLEIKKGEMAVVAGPSGSGKTTLLNLMGGLDRPTMGTVMAGGTDLGALDEQGLAMFRRKSVGFLFQSGNLIPGLSALENVELPLLLAGIREGRKEKALEMLRLVGLSDRAESMPVTLSGGEHQRVALARALVYGPSLILADEPTASLDSQTASTIFGLIKDINARIGTTVVMATHDPALIGRAPHVVHLHDGMVVSSPNIT
jgi:putative ABC transport system ATP-binding protein